MNFPENDYQILIELIYLGNWVVNSTRNPKNQISEYAQFAHSVFQSVGASEEELYDKLEVFIEQYENNIFPSLFAEKYTHYKFSHLKNTESNILSIKTQKDFQKSCENEILLNGLANITLDIH